MQQVSYWKSTSTGANVQNLVATGELPPLIRKPLV
jgi:hypothetical protein